MSQPPNMFPYSAPNKSADETEKKGATGSAAPAAGIRDTTQPSPFSRPAVPQEQRPASATTPSQPASPVRPEPFSQRPFTPAAPASFGQTAPGMRPLQTAPASSPLAAQTANTGTGYGAANQSALGQTGAGRPYLGQTGQGQPNLGQSNWNSPLRQSTPATAGTSGLPSTTPPASGLFTNRTVRPGSGTLPGATSPSGGAGALRSGGLTPGASTGSGVFQSGAGAAAQGSLPPRPSLFRSTQPGEALRQPLSPTAAFRAPATAPASARATSPFRKDLQITDEEFLQLRDFIYQQCGIFIAENRKYLVENRLSNRIKDLNLKSYSEYYNYLRFDASRRTELNKLFEVMTTNETSFFRNPPQLEVFQKQVLPGILDLCRQKGSKKLRIWSAGCSTGEEPYTLAIILHEVLKSEIHSWDIKITANDLSEAVLSAARQGIYSEYALRTTPKEIVDAYFIKDGSLYRIKPELKNIVSFGQINLSDREQLKRVERSQIVFCRNVIIYFDDEMKRKVINAFYDNLEINGALLIGHSESLHNISRAFQLEHFKGTIVYRKLA
uniref:protein-glutamate O-methyltransferase n=1 Tax=Desulfovibrio desulfuricans (strain ATCC 27774 / DSM 6949 / MB) TaxID=525146 RepID=B8J0K4_DESDA